MEQLTERDLELLEHKLRGTLSESGKAALEEKMQEKGFAQAAADFEMLLVGIDAKGDTELKTMLQEEEAKFEIQTKDEESPKTAKVFSLRRIMAVAASLLLLAVATFVWQQDGQKANHFADNFTPYKNVLYPIDRSSGTVSAKEEAFKAYEQKEYAAALKGFDTILSDSLDYGVLFFKANTLLAMKDVDEAIPLFDRIPQHERFYEQSQWYLGLAYLEKGDVTAAKSYLKTVAVNGGFKSEQAQEILKTLE